MYDIFTFRMRLRVYSSLIGGALHLLYLGISKSIRGGENAFLFRKPTIRFPGYMKNAPNSETTSRVPWTPRTTLVAIKKLFVLIECTA